MYKKRVEVIGLVMFNDNKKPLPTVGNGFYSCITAFIPVLRTVFLYYGL